MSSFQMDLIKFSSVARSLFLPAKSPSSIFGSFFIKDRVILVKLKACSKIKEGNCKNIFSGSVHPGETGPGLPPSGGHKEHPKQGSSCCTLPYEI